MAVIIAVFASKPKLFIYALPILIGLWLTRRMAKAPRAEMRQVRP